MEDKKPKNKIALIAFGVSVLTLILSILGEAPFIGFICNALATICLFVFLILLLISLFKIKGHRQNWFILLGIAFFAITCVYVLTTK